MAITYHKAITDDGGAIGVEIASGVVNALLREILLDDQNAGATISRKFYVVNSEGFSVRMSSFSLHAYTVFPAILFESTGDAQVVGDLTGFEVDESPILDLTIPAGGHNSFWIQVDVPAGSTKTDNYNKVNVKQIL